MSDCLDFISLLWMITLIFLLNIVDFMRIIGCKSKGKPINLLIRIDTYSMNTCLMNHGRKVKIPTMIVILIQFAMYLK